jgi:hypothetical protein
MLEKVKITKKKIKNLRQEKFKSTYVQLKSWQQITYLVLWISANCREGNYSMVTGEDFKAVKIGEVIIS